jgi:hypothetical protein
LGESLSLLSKGKLYSFFGQKQVFSNKKEQFNCPA